MSTVQRWSGAHAIARTRTVDLAAAGEQAADRACRYLFNRQNVAGYWVGELEADTTLESDYVALQLWLYPPAADGSWNPPTRGRVDAACCRILERQLPAGGWNIYAGGPANVSASVKAYFALKLAGFHPRDERMRRARDRIRGLGGVEAANSYTKIYLSYFGLYPRSKIPSIPPEIFLLPENNRFGVYGMSSWSRAILAPLSILSAKKALRAVPRGFHLEEIFSGVEPEPAERLSWKQFFLLVDKGLKLWEASGIRADRRKAIDAAAEWMFARLEDSDGLGAIYPAMMNSIMALTELGLDRGDPRLQREIERFDALILEDEEGFRVQPCHSPVWDTAMTVFAIASATDDLEEPDRWALARAADWLVRKQVRKKGDWSVKRPRAEPGGWYFEHANEFYPDTDDTAKALPGARSRREQRCRAAAPRGAPRRRLAGRDAICRRGLGGFRRGQQRRDSDPTCLSPITTRCSIRPAPTLPGGWLRRFPCARRTAAAPQSAAASITCAAIRKKTGVGTGAGA